MHFRTVRSFCCTYLARKISEVAEVRPAAVLLELGERASSSGCSRLRRRDDRRQPALDAPLFHGWTAYSRLSIFRSLARLWNKVDRFLG